MVHGRSVWIGFHIHQIVVVAAVDAAGVVGAVAVAVADAEGDVVVAVGAAAADGDDEQGLWAPWGAVHDCNVQAWTG